MLSLDKDHDKLVLVTTPLETDRIVHKEVGLVEYGVLVHIDKAGRPGTADPPNFFAGDTLTFKRMAEPGDRVFKNHQPSTSEVYLVARNKSSAPEEDADALQMAVEVETEDAEKHQPLAKRARRAPPPPIPVKGMGKVKSNSKFHILSLCILDLGMETTYAVRRPKPSSERKVFALMNEGVRVKDFPSTLECIEHIKTNQGVDILYELAHNPTRLFPSVVCENAASHFCALAADEEDSADEMQVLEPSA